MNLLDMPKKKKRKSKSQKRTRNSSSKGQVNSLSSKSNLAKLGIEVGQMTNSDSENEVKTPLSIEANDSSNDSQIDENEMLHQLMLSEQWEETE